MELDPVENDLPLSDELRAELDRRIEEDDTDRSPAEDWASLREKLLQEEF